MLDVEKCSPARVTSLDIASIMASLNTPASLMGATVMGLGLFIALTSSLTTSGRNTGEATEGRKESVEARRS
jgi:Mn2+/Fe2+ NRAMP family transporter